jgi:hypothetical protein
VNHHRATKQQLGIPRTEFELRSGQGLVILMQTG